MANSRQIVALNVGSQRVSMGVFSKTSKDALILDRYATRLVVLDPSAEGLRLTKIGEAIADLVQELNVKGSVANYSVSGQSVFIRFVKLPALDDTDVEQLIRFEAQQHVPFPLDEVVGDYHLLPAKGLEREAVLVAIKAEDLDSLNDEIVSHNLSTGKVDCALTSLYNAYVDSYPDEKEPVMLIDIGAKSTDLIYSEQGRFFTRSISAGGIFVTSAIAREFNVPFMEAERLKTTSGLVSMSNGQTEGLDPATANLATVIRTAMTRLASEIQRTTNHYRAQMNGSAPVKAYLCGGGASLPYTKEFLEDKLGIPISFFNPMHNVGVGSGVDVNTISREAFILGGLIGTAVNAIGRASLNIDLEPTAIAKKRANQKKMPAIIAGAAIAVLGAAAYAVWIYGRAEGGGNPRRRAPHRHLHQVGAIRPAPEGTGAEKTGRHPGLLPAAHATALRICGHHQAPAGTVGTQGLSLLVHGLRTAGPLQSGGYHPDHRLLRYQGFLHVG